MKKEIKTRQQLIERLNEIDRRCIDSNRHFYDLRTLFEAKEYKLSAQDKADIKKVASIEDDPDTLKAYIDSKAIEEDFEQDWDPEDYAGGYTEWDLIDSKRTTEGESYNLWYNEFKDKWVCTSGDSDIYYPENVPEYDAEFEDEDEAREWFEDCINGSCDEEDLELVTDDMNGGQWFESLNEKFSPFAVFDKYGFKQFDADTEEQALSYMNKYKKDGNILVNAEDKVVAVQKYKKGKWTLEKDVNEEIDLNSYNDGYVELRDGKSQFVYSTLRDAKNGMFWSQMGDNEHGLGKHSYEIKKWENGVLKDLNESRIPRTVEFGKEGHYAPPARGTISDISELNVGDRIYHSSYNQGTVDKIKDNKAYVKFDNYKGVRIFPNNAVQYLSKVDRPHISEEFNEMPEKSFLPPTGIGWFDKMYRELSDKERWQMNHIIKNIFYVKDDELPNIDEDTLDRIADKFLDTTIDESYEDGEYDYFVVYKGKTLQGEYPTYSEAKRNAGEGCTIKGVIQYGGSEFEETEIKEPLTEDIGEYEEFEYELTIYIDTYSQDDYFDYNEFDYIDTDDIQYSLNSYIDNMKSIFTEFDFELSEKDTERNTIIYTLYVDVPTDSTITEEQLRTDIRKYINKWSYTATEEVSEQTDVDDFITHYIDIEAYADIDIK